VTGSLIEGGAVATTPANGEFSDSAWFRRQDDLRSCPLHSCKSRVVEPGIGGVATVLDLSFKFALGRRRGGWL